VIAMFVRGLVRDGLALSSFEGDSAMGEFLEFITGPASRGGYTGSTHDTVDTHVGMLFDAHALVLRTHLLKMASLFHLPVMSTMTDEWTAHGLDQYLGVGVRVMNPTTLRPQSFFAMLHLLEEAANMSNTLLSVLSKLLDVPANKVEDFFVGGSSDNANAATASVRLAVNVVVRCIGHTLSLAVRSACAEGSDLDIFDGDDALRKAETTELKNLSPLTAFIRKVQIVVTHFGRSALASRLLEKWCVGRGHAPVNLKRTSPTRWSQLWDNVLKLGEALDARLDEFLVDYTRSRAKDAGASKGVIACLTFDAADKVLVGQLRDVLKPVQVFNLLAQRDGLSLAEGFMGAVELFCELDATRIRKTSLGGDWEVNAAASTEHFTMYVTHEANDMDQRAISLRQKIKEQVFARFLNYDVISEEDYCSIWFDPRVRAKLLAVSEDANVEKLEFLRQGEKGMLLLSSVREYLTTRATSRLAETCGIKFDSLSVNCTTPIAPTFQVYSPQALGDLDVSARARYRQLLAAHAASSTSTTTTISTQPVATLESHIAKEIDLFESLIVMPEYFNMSGSEFFVATRSKFPQQLMLLYSIFCSNRVLSPSNAKIESVFSQAARVTPSERASTDPAKVNQLMVVRMSSLITPEFTLKVAAGMPSPGPVPAVAN